MILNNGQRHHKTLNTSAKQKLLGLIIDQDLDFESHSKAIIKKYILTSSAFIRVAPNKITHLNKKLHLLPSLKSISIIIHCYGCSVQEL